jgi:hypothetical protein
VLQPQWLYNLNMFGLSIGFGTTAWFTALQVSAIVYSFHHKLT